MTDNVNNLTSCAHDDGCVESNLCVIEAQQAERLRITEHGSHNLRLKTSQTQVTRQSKMYRTYVYFCLFLVLSLF